MRLYRVQNHYIRVFQDEQICEYRFPVRSLQRVFRFSSRFVSVNQPCGHRHGHQRICNSFVPIHYPGTPYPYKPGKRLLKPFPGGIRPRVQHDIRHASRGERHGKRVQHVEVRGKQRNWNFISHCEFQKRFPVIFGCRIYQRIPV